MFIVFVEGFLRCKILFFLLQVLAGSQCGTIMILVQRIIAWQSFSKVNQNAKIGFLIYASATLRHSEERNSHTIFCMNQISLIQPFSFHSLLP